jgi:5-formyltetrahydrofolate cyclo-ligase
MVTVALAFEFQVKPEVPFEEFDILPAKIVTEKRIIA